MTVGTATFGNTGSMGFTDLAGATRQIDMCLDHGVNLIDTANAYSAGRSEEMIGEVLSGEGRRARMLIATKVRGGMGQGPNERGLSRQHIIEQCEASLKRLNTDVIDIYQVHGWDGQVPLEETVEALDRLVKDGKVRYLGCSNFSGWHIMKALAEADSAHRHRLVSQQIAYTLFSREAEFELLPISHDQGLGVLVFSPTAGGLLTGKYRRDVAPEGTRWTQGWREPPIHDRERLHSIIDVIVEIAGELNVSGAQVAIAWVLQRPTVTSAIIGGRTDEQFADNLGAAELELSADQVARLDKVSQIDLIYPYWHQNWNARDRLGPADMVLHAPHLKDQ